uniref:Sleeping Beauty transposase HTH domain-containing protein n=1 Tax=Oncorhynchus tshawytscha TaxID=74940 RepID=A0AAZ3QKR2_ONCTS
MSEQKPTVRLMELSVYFRDRIVSRYRSWEGYQNISAALKVPKNTVTSIILKWKKFGTIKTLPRAGRLAKLSNPRRRALVREVTEIAMVTLTEFQSSSVELGKPSRRTIISAALHQLGLYGSKSGSPQKKGTLQPKKRYLKDSQTMRNKILWSDETKIELLNAK